MEIIGLTGSIGMGKSLAASMVKRLGIPVFDSDSCVHALLAGRALPLIRAAFPSVWDTDAQFLDKRKLATLIFTDAVAKERLESLLHPMVWEEQQKFIAKSRRAGKKQIVLDIPLLFETGRERICNRVICVTAPPFIQKQRVLSRKNMTPEKLTAILNSQIKDKDKQRYADITVPTGLGRRITFVHLKKALKAKGQK
jgi:dephospho-CoA kinase